jgi:SAM-dependent methyltransferase
MTPAPAIGYDDGQAWAAGPAQVYDRLAAAAVALLPGPLAGMLVLDAGAGTGAATRALRGHGATVIAVDLSLSMLRAGLSPGVVGDITRLPVSADAVDSSIAAFVLSHLRQPEAAMAELVRVTRPGGLVAATAFPAGLHHPVKAAIDQVLEADGYRPPQWYSDLKTTGEARVGAEAALARLAGDAGLVGATVDMVTVEIAPLGVEAVVSWRLGMAQISPYVKALGADQRHRLLAKAHAAAATAGLDQPLQMLVLRARVGPRVSDS